MQKKDLAYYAIILCLIVSAVIAISMLMATLKISVPLLVEEWFEHYCQSEDAVYQLASGVSMAVSGIFSFLCLMSVFNIKMDDSEDNVMLIFYKLFKNSFALAFISSLFIGMFFIVKVIMMPTKVQLLFAGAGLAVFFSLLCLVIKFNKKAGYYQERVSGDNL